LHARQKASILFSSSALSGAPVTVDRAIPSALSSSATSSIPVGEIMFYSLLVLVLFRPSGYSKHPPSSRFNAHPTTDCTLYSVNSLKAPALRPASTLQLALNLLDFRRIVCSDCEVTGEDYVQHVNECVSRDVHQFFEHGLLSLNKMKIALDIRNPGARRGLS
jgi:hypothetical protein